MIGRLCSRARDTCIDLVLQAFVANEHRLSLPGLGQIGGDVLELAGVQSLEGVDHTAQMTNRHALQQATRTMHDWAERRWAGENGVPVDLDRFLRAMYCLHASYGVAAAACVGRADEIERERTRIMALRADLGWVPQVAYPVDALVPEKRDAAWGALYSLNGSALGAGVLLRVIADNSAAPSVYLKIMSDFARSGELASFFRTLNQQALDHRVAAKGACAVFAVLAGSCCPPL